MANEETREFAEEVVADHVVMAQAGANTVKAEQVEMQQAGAVTIAADKVDMERSGAVLIRSKDMELNQSGGWIVVTDNLKANNTTAGFLIARSVEGEVRSLLDLRTALGIGAGMGAALFVLLSLFRLFGRRAR